MCVVTVCNSSKYFSWCSDRMTGNLKDNLENSILSGLMESNRSGPLRRGNLCWALSSQWFYCQSITLTLVTCWIRRCLSTFSYKEANACIMVTSRKMCLPSPLIKNVTSSPSLKFKSRGCWKWPRVLREHSKNSPLSVAPITDTVCGLPFTESEMKLSINCVADISIIFLVIFLSWIVQTQPNHEDFYCINKISDEYLLVISSFVSQIWPKKVIVDQKWYFNWNQSIK